MSRSIDSTTLAASKATTQCAANGNAPRLSFWINRPVTQLVDSHFLETLDVPGLSEIADCSIAVKHTKFGRSADAIYIAYVVGGVSNADGGVAKVYAAKSVEVMKRHSFSDTGFQAAASRVAVVFDGTMPKRVSNTYEFITETQPWVFWISQGALYAQQLGSTDTITLAEQNCTWVSAVRAMWSEVAGFDFGLCVFLILSGALYYRQRIGGTWYDAEAVPVASLPTLASGVTWIEVAASRTGDYRIVLQLKASDGALYEVFTQFGGLGSKGAEHIEVRDVAATGKLTAVTYHDTAAQDQGHIEIVGVTAGAPYGGLYSTAVPKIISASSADDGTGNWGKLATFTFDVHLKAAEVAAQASAFSIVDVNNVTYNAATASLGVDGKTVTLTFTDFNNARGECKATYTAGTVTSMAGTTLTTASCSFTPTGLVPTAVPAPEVTEVTNV
jgi:hypothetical protein